MPSAIPAAKNIRPESTVRVDLYTHTSDVWYEDPGIRQLDPEFLAIVRREAPAAPFRRSSIWVHVAVSQEPMPAEGWKLHLSASDADAPRVLAAAAKLCIARGITFKFLGDRWLLSLANSKMWPREASGKFVVLYPRTTEEFMEVGAELDEILADCRGPYVLSDRRFGKSESIYYRYGGFIQQTRVQADGTRVPLMTAPGGQVVSDQRRPYFWLPPGCDDPVKKANAPASTVPARADGPAAKPGRVCVAGRFVVENALTSGQIGFTSAGGVYRATDLVTNQMVVLKEARPFIGKGEKPLGYAIEALEREYYLLEALDGTDTAPRPVGLFWDSGHRHRFMAETFVPGAGLGSVLISLNPILDQVANATRRKDFVAFLQKAWKKLAEVVAVIHARNVCIGDLSFTNILVHNWEGDLELRIIDLEGGWISGDTSSRVCTPGFTHQLDSDSGIARADMEKQLSSRDMRDDLFSLGRVMLGSLLPATSLAILDRKGANRLFRAAAAGNGIPESVLQFIMRLTSQNPEERPTAAEVAAYFSDVACFEGPVADMPQLPIPVESEEFRQALGTHIIGSGDVSRADRVFPADPRVYTTNGVNLAYGISGVIHGLISAGIPVNRSFQNWLLSQAMDPERFSPGLLTGLAGVASVLSEMGENELAVSTLLNSARHRIIDEDPFMFGGAAGVGLSALWLYGRTRDERLLHEADRLASQLAAPERGVGAGRWTTSAGDTPIGMMYGTAGISLFLLYAWLATGNEKYRAAGEEAIRITLGSKVILDGRDFWTFPSYANKGEKRLRHYWADGSAGIGAALLRWIQATSNPEHEVALQSLLPDTQRNMTIFPSLLSGMSGIAMFHVDMFRFRGTQSALDTCDTFARHIGLYGISRPDGIGMPGDQLQRLSTDFATGAAGVLMFLSHLDDARKGKPGNHFGVVPLPDFLLTAKP